MKETAAPPLPFCISRDRGASLTDQIEAGLRRAIETGRYRAGEVLPTLQEMAGALGVSLAVVRTAVRRLSREGVVTARPRRGIEVSPAGQHRWQGHVLYLHWASATSYYEAVLSETAQRRLLAKRILVTSIHLSGAEVAAGSPQVISAIDAGPVDMAVVAGRAEVIGALLAERGIPFVQVAGGGDRSRSRLVRGFVETDAQPALEAAVAHAVSCGVRTVAILPAVGGNGGAMGRLAAAAGLSVRVIGTTAAEGAGLPESVHRGGLVAMARFLASGEPLPDLFFFADDYVAQGALTALLAAGVRVPQEVQVIAWANRNLGPVFPKPLTRVEMDPVRDGLALADLVLEALQRPAGKARRPVSLRPAFIVGETTLQQSVRSGPGSPLPGQVRRGTRRRTTVAPARQRGGRPAALVDSVDQVDSVDPVAQVARKKRNVAALPRKQGREG